MQQFEYLHLFISNKDGVLSVNGEKADKRGPSMLQMVSKLGREGWEMVSVSTYPWGDTLKFTEIWFKRPF